MEMNITADITQNLSGIQKIKAERSEPVKEAPRPETLVMDKEFMTSFFFLCAGIPYEKNESNSRWA